MNHNEQVWEEYLSSRPNLNRWYSYCEQDRFLSRDAAILKDKVMNGEETKYDKKVADLDDGEALAYFVYMDSSNNDLLINSKAVKHVQPSINLDEAEYAATQGWSYIHLLCARELGGSFTSNESLDNMDFTDDLLQTINDYRIHKFHHIVWNTEHDLVKTVVRYKDYRNLFKVYTDSDILIDSDFLDDYLLADKPEPTEIDKNTWHDMAVRLIEKLDDENKDNRIRMGHMNFLEYVSTGLVSCFLTRNIEELAFMESVYDFCVSASNYPGFMGRNVRDSYQPGMLEPKLFDLLREYGASFVEPLLENTLIERRKNIMNHNKQVWKEYLSSRPNFNKWCHYCLNSKKHDYLSSRFSFMQNMIETEGKTEHGRKVTDLTDGEALAYFMYPYIDVGLVLAESKAVKPFRPSINFDEAKYMDDNNLIATWVDFLCTRELSGDSTSDEYWNDIRFADDLLETIDKYESHHIPHMVWNTAHDLIRTVIECNDDYCRLFEARCNKVIDSDYLDHYLLAPKPDPADIDKGTWHRMSVKLIKWLDEDNDKTQSTRHFNNDLLGFMSDGLASCFLTHNLEDLSFMKTVYDLCASIPHYKFRNMRKSYHPGMLDPELFDLLREHEAASVRPLLEQALRN